jgi:hypothetical protein
MHGEEKRRKSGRGLATSLFDCSLQQNVGGVTYLYFAQTVSTLQRLPLSPPDPLMPGCCI